MSVKPDPSRCPTTTTASARRRLSALALLLGVAGCASVQQPLRDHLDSTSAGVRDCAHWFEQLDRAVARAGVSDIAARRIAGFPYLRVDRFTAARRDETTASPRLHQAWAARMRDLDRDGRRVEIANLPSLEIERLGGGRDLVAQRTGGCAKLLAQLDSTDAEAKQLLLRRARVEDDYSSLQRALGLYELTRLPFHAGVKGWQEDAARAIDAARRGEPPRLPLQRYRPPAETIFSRREVGQLLARAARDPLGLAQLTDSQKRRLFATYAPLLEIETGGDFDRIGAIYWGDDGYPRVDVSSPTVYHRLEYTRVGGHSLLQLVYVAWLPERPRKHAFDLLGGHLDGIVWRVTLAPDGEPLLFDSIHPCGCYHMFLPTPRVEPLPASERGVEWAFIPATLPRIADGERLVVSLESRTHYLRNAWPGADDTGTTYRFADYNQLRSLPLPGGGRRSLFGPDGLVAGTERRERFLFWPMGIASAGAMRQAGSQATAFVGRRHFDDADIIDKRFRQRD